MYQINPMYQIADFGHGSASHKHFEQLPVDWERGIIFQILQHRSHKLFFPATPAFVLGEFVKSHLLSSLQFFHFMDISDASFSKCFFSLSQFFKKPGLLSSLHTHNLHSQFPNDWNELVFEIHEWNCQEGQLHILASRFQILLLK